MSTNNLINECVPLKKRHILFNDEDTFVDFSLQIPHLTYYLNNILKRYPLGGQILKELLQNAEDSGASVVKFFIDLTEYPTEKLLNPSLKHFQGPALLAYNNSKFEKNDFESIRNIEKSTKYDKPLKIGKFGLGFNSIYHLTDLPTIISGKHLIIFDPHEKYFLDYGKCKRGIKLEFEIEESLLTECKDQFEPYVNIHLDDAANSRINFKDEFKGTFFRFPIRTKEASEISELTKEWKPIEQIVHDDILKSFYKDFNLILLFLRCLERIEIYEVKDKSQTLLASSRINFDRSTPNLKQTRQNLIDYLNKSVEADKTMSMRAFDFEDFKSDYKMSLETKILNRETNKFDHLNEEYLISNYVKFRSSSESLRNLSLSTSTIPTCSVAYKVNNNASTPVSVKELSDKFKHCRYFCFLPMPETIESSGLPFHINGSFGLRDDRRDFKWLSNDCLNDQAAKWNQLMVDEVLNMALVQMLNFAQRQVESNSSSSVDNLSINEFYYLLPDPKNISLNWKEKHLKSFLENLADLNLIYTTNGEWANIKDILLSNVLDNDLNRIEQFREHSSELKQAIYKLFDSKQLATTQIPEHVVHIYQQKKSKSLTLNFINHEMIIKIILSDNNNKLSKLSDQEKFFLSNYLIFKLNSSGETSANSLNDLIGTKLLPLLNKTWIKYAHHKQNFVFYFENTEEEKMLNENNAISSSIFDQKQLSNESNKLLRIHLNDNKPFAQLVLYKPKHFALLLRKLLSTNLIKTVDWLEKIWKYIFINFNDSLEQFEDLELIPASSSLKFLNLKSSQSHKYFYYSSGDKSESDLSNETISFLVDITKRDFFMIYDKENLPAGLREHSKFKDYFTRLHSICLIDCFEMVYDFVGIDTIRSELEQNVAARQALLEDLNLIKKVNFPFNKKVNNILKDLPIFKRFSVDEFCSAESCQMQQAPVAAYEILNLLNQNHIERLLDTRSCANLAKNLQLKTFDFDELILKSLEPSTRTSTAQLTSLIEWSLLNLSKFNDKAKFFSCLLTKKIFGNRTNGLNYLHELFDSNDKYVNMFVPVELQLNMSLSKEPFYSIVKDKLNRTISSQHFESFMLKIQSQKSIDMVKFTIEFLKNNPQYVISTFKFNWLPSTKNEYLKSEQLFAFKLNDLIGLTQPVLHQQIDSLLEKFIYNELKIKESANMNQVYENYLQLIQEFNQIEDAMLKLDKIYSYFMNPVNNFNSDKMSSIPVYDGNGMFYDANKVVLDSLVDLAPYYHVLPNSKSNEFIKKFKSLYTEKFKIIPKVSVDILIQFLHALSNNNNTATMTTCETKSRFEEYLRVKLVFDLLEEKFASDLIENEDLRKRILLPVESLDPKNEPLRFELISKCVYDVQVDDDDTADDDNIQYKIEACNELNLSICLRRINVDFLKKLGVESLTKKVMKINSLLYDRFGQHEDLTDRIRKLLLLGYRDGIAICKEIIQNADDANATVVKFCYDKRTNKQWRNPKKLLDTNMVKAQGPALLVYNDAVFSDKDFENIIRLGSGGSKQADSEKIGEFTLGFTSTYNITDVPSIVSAKSFVLFDPNIKFLPSLIDASNPGIRINLAEKKRKDLEHYSDQFRPYENIFDCRILSRSDDNNNTESAFFYNATLFRFPLRNEPSKISTHLYDNDGEIKSLFEIIYNNAHSLLLFTQSVRNVEFYVIDEHDDVDELNDDGPNMKLLFKFEKMNPIKYLSAHDISFDDNDDCDKNSQSCFMFKRQSSILKATSIAVKRKMQKKIETSFIIENKLTLNKMEFAKLMGTSFQINQATTTTHWLLCSSFNPLFLKNDIPNFLPCVGMAAKVKCLDSNQFELDPCGIGILFCFLPMSIETKLNYHINAAFALTDDRLHLYELTKDDKSHSKKDNKLLIQPLVENLIATIKHAALNTCNNRKDLIIEYFWPLLANNENTTSQFLIDFEKSFYETIITHRIDIYPVDTSSDSLSFSNFENSIFIDFNFDDESIQNLAREVLSELKWKLGAFAPKKCLVYLPSAYLSKVKCTLLTQLNLDDHQKKFLNEFDLLKLLVNFKNKIKPKENYTKLLMFYLKRKSFETKSDDLTPIGQYIKDSACIPTSSNDDTCFMHFQRASCLINSNAHKFYSNWFDKSENRFPYHELTSDAICLFNLNNMGLLNRHLNSEILCSVANKIKQTLKANSLQKQRARNLSNELLTYLNEIYASGDDQQVADYDLIKHDLNQIEWIFAKEKPDDWLLPWNSNSTKQLYRPSELITDKYQALIAGVRPIQCQQIKFFPSSSSNNLSDEALVDLSIEQLKLNLEFYQATTNNSALLEEIRTFCLKFYSNLQQFSTENRSLSRESIQERINLLKSKLANLNWIYLHESKAKFFKLDSFALDVNNEVEPLLLKMSSTYTDDHYKRNFFEKMGLKNHFEIDTLRRMLVEMKNKFNETKLDNDAMNTCIKIVNEMIYVEDSKQTSNNTIRLEKMATTSDAILEMYLPDENCIMRPIGCLCDEKPQHFLNDASSELNLFVLNDRISSKRFGIRTLKSKLMSKIGEPFGQHEQLTLRIKNILNSYSKSLCIFKELIQNADDAEATEIAFILDTRTLSKEKIFSESYGQLQGPSLCCWNNKTFSEKDLKGLIDLGQGSKKSDLNTAGRFGVGFNSVYHITNAPQMISNFDDYLMFDPLCKYLPDLDVTNPGIRIKNAKKYLNGTVYSDVLSGFQFDRFPLENSTMFRFPLRTHDEQSEMSPLVLNKQDAKNLIYDFTLVCEECVIFLKHIKKVSFYELDEMNSLKLTYEQNIGFKNNEDRQKQATFKSQLAANYNIIQPLSAIPPVQTSYEILITNNRSPIVSNYLLVEQFGYNQNLDPIQVYLKTMKPKYFPFAALAYNLNNLDQGILKNSTSMVSSAQTNYKIYNYLPLDQSSILNCHMHACWSLHHENRRNLYEFEQRTENVNKEDAKWYTDWNLLIINNLIGPLYLFLMETIKPAVNNNQVLNYCKFLRIDNQKDKSLCPYFKGMLTVLFKNLHTKELLPIKNHITNLIEWHAPAKIFFDTSLKSYESKEILKNLIVKAKIPLCGENDLISIFEQNANIKLNPISSTAIIDGFKLITNSLIGKKIDSTIFQTPKNLIALLDFCIKDFKLKDEALTLERCPFLITHDNTITSFSSASANKLFFYEYPEIFGSKSNLFLSKDLVYFFHQVELKCETFVSRFFKQITVSDLSTLISDVLDSRTYDSRLNNNSVTYLNLNNCAEIQKIIQIWRIIEEDCSRKKLNEKKTALLNHLSAIQAWKIIPVFSKRDNTEILTLSPISNASNILTNKSSASPDFQSYFIWKIVRNLDLFETLARHDNLPNSLLETITVQLDKNEDLLKFLDRNKALYKNIFNNDQVKCSLFEYFNQCIRQEQHYIRRKKSHLTYEFSLKIKDSLIKTEIIQIIKQMPIFKTLFDTYESIGTNNNSTSANVYLLELNSNMPKELIQIFDHENFLQSHICIDLLDFCNKTETILIRNETKYQDIFKFLELKQIKIEQLYEMFFIYHIKEQKDLNGTSIQLVNKIFKDHLDIIKMLYVNKIIDDKSVLMVNYLYQIRFIKIDENYFRADETCSQTHEIFSKILGKKALPNEYQSCAIWLEFLKKLGMKTICNQQDCLEVANSLAYKFNNSELSLNELDAFCKLLFDDISNLDEKSIIELMPMISKIKFIPNYYLFPAQKHKITTILYKGYHKSCAPDLICLEGSTFNINEPYCWLTKSILPNYCKTKLIKNEYMDLASISYLITNESFMENFLQLIEYLNKLNINSFKNKVHLVELFQKIFSKLLDIFNKMQDKADEENLLQSLVNKAFIPITFHQNEIKLIKPNVLFKMIGENEQIEDFLYKLPHEYLNYWEMLKYLGAKDHVPYDMCQTILEHYFVQLKITKQQKLNEKQLTSVLIVLKKLICDDILMNATKAEMAQKKLYFPNANNNMVDLTQLYYMDNHLIENLCQNCEQLRSICLIDIKMLKKFIENMSSSTSTNSSSNFMRMLMRDLNWNDIFSLFEQNVSVMPMPLSKIILKKVCFDDEKDEDNVLCTKLMSLINSDSFLSFLVNAIQIISRSLLKEEQQEKQRENKFSFDSTVDIADVLNEADFKSKIKIIKIYEKVNLTEYYFNSEIEEKIENSEKQVNFAQIKPSKVNNTDIEEQKLEWKVFVNNNSEEKFQINCFLARVILEFITDFYFKKTSHAAFSAKLVDVIKKKIYLDFFLLILTPLQHENSSTQIPKPINYEQLIQQFSINSF